ncbi:MAG: hypothetical protein K2Q06_07825 [Parvularculaceae bacterium]|nr:hypothetical protein [Parvularculaceae bacterium]
MFAIMIATFVVHEGAHGVAGAALGYPMEVSSNHASPVGGKAERHDAMTITAAGPAATILGAFLAAAFIPRALLGFQIVLAAFLMRLLASGISLVSPNDEMRLSVQLGLHPWALPGVVTVALLLTTIYVAARARPGVKATGLMLLGAVLGIALATAGEGFLPELTIPSLR